ncbi:MAG: SseB family protein [Terracoccus sp.]
MGEADPALLAALDDPADETVLMRAVARARLLVPIVATPTAKPTATPTAKPTAIGTVIATATPDEAHDSGALMVEPRASRHATDMAVVTLTSSDGQRAMPVFSSLAALTAWDGCARPSPVTSARAAQSAVTERCEVMVLDLGSPHERILRPSMVWALAQQRDWLPAHSDPFVAAALSRATAHEDDVIDCVGEDGPAGGGGLRVVLSLRTGLGAAEVQALATRIGEQIATDGEARARIDGLAFIVRQAR